MQTIERKITVPTPLARGRDCHPKGATKLLEPLLPLGLKRLGDKTSDQLETCLRALAGAPSSQESS